MQSKGCGKRERGGGRAGRRRKCGFYDAVDHSVVVREKERTSKTRAVGRAREKRRATNDAGMTTERARRE